MIIKLFKHKGPSAGAVNYCLSEKDHNKQTRSVPPKILRGDPDFTKELDKATKKYSVQATSGVIAFRDNENLTEAQKQKLIDDFEDTFIGSKLKESVNCLYVEHREKNNLEIHFIINNITLDSKPKCFNPFPPGHEKLKDAFVAKKNYEFGFEQVQHKNILKLGLNGDEKKALKNTKGTDKKHGFDNLNDKKILHSFLVSNIKNGTINNRNELINFIKKDLKLEVTRVGADYISVKPDGENRRNIRLKGDIYADNNNVSYKEIQRNLKENNSNFNIETVNKNYLVEMEKRVVFNKKRYKSNDDIRGYDKTLNINNIKTQQQINKPQQTEKYNHNKTEVINNLKSIRQNQNQQEQKEQKQNVKQEEFVGEQITTDEALYVATDAQEQLHRAIARLASAKTPEETAKANMDVVKARILAIREIEANWERKQKILAQQEQKRLAELNRPKPRP